MELRFKKHSIGAASAAARQLGFTLMELMVVVAIIGVLASVAVPNYRKYQNKAHQAEGKIYLSGIYAGQKSFFSEYSAYIMLFDAIGFAPEGVKRYYASTACTNPVGSPWLGSVTGYSGGGTINHYDQQNAPYAQVWNPAASCVTPSCGSFGNDPQTFTAVVYATPNVGGTTDLLTINDLKQLLHCSNGL